MKKTISLFIILLIILASLPIGFLGHELWHIGFSYFYGGKPVALCINFGGNLFASALIDMSEVTIDRCYIHFVDEIIAYPITIGIILVMIYIFTKKYLDLSKNVRK